MGLNLEHSLVSSPANASHPRLVHCPELADGRDVFEDRRDAGGVLADMLRQAGLTPDLVLAIPAGGVPVGAAMARELQVPLDVAVVSKITLPWNREAGYGAVAFDGTTALNEALVRQCGLTREDVEDGVAQTRSKVRRRARTLRPGLAPLQLHDGQRVVVVDDGLASGFTMNVALTALRKLGRVELVVAVPTAHQGALARVASNADVVVCANLRSETPFAVASAYRHWQDVPEARAEILLEQARGTWQSY